MMYHAPSLDVSSWRRNLQLLKVILKQSLLLVCGECLAHLAIDPFGLWCAGTHLKLMSRVILVVVSVTTS